MNDKGRIRDMVMALSRGDHEEAETAANEVMAAKTARITAGNLVEVRDMSTPIFTPPEEYAAKLHRVGFSVDEFVSQIQDSKPIPPPQEWVDAVVAAMGGATEGMNPMRQRRNAMSGRRGQQVNARVERGMRGRDRLRTNETGEEFYGDDEEIDNMGRLPSPLQGADPERDDLEPDWDNPEEKTRLQWMRSDSRMRSKDDTEFDQDDMMVRGRRVRGEY